MGFLSDLADDLIDTTAKIITAPVVVTEKVVETLEETFDSDEEDEEKEKE